VWTEIHDVMWPLCEEIMRLPVHTMGDLILHARATALMNADYWTENDELDSGTIAVRLLIENVCRLVGTEPMPGVEVVPIEYEDEDA
jgi:hypothetical protein